MTSHGLRGLHGWTWTSARTRLRLSVLALGLSVSAVRPLLSQGTRPAKDSETAKRLAWFHEAKYGLFIHWGLYAIPAGEWKGKRIPGIGEWIMNRRPFPCASTSSSRSSSTR